MATSLDFIAASDRLWSGVSDPESLQIPVKYFRLNHFSLSFMWIAGHWVFSLRQAGENKVSQTKVNVIWIDNLVHKLKKKEIYLLHLKRIVQCSVGLRHFSLGLRQSKLDVQESLFKVYGFLCEGLSILFFRPASVDAFYQTLKMYFFSQAFCLCWWCSADYQHWF